MARYDDLNTSAIAYATFIGSVFLLIVILLFRGLCYYWMEGEVDRKLANSHYVEADAAIVEQKARVNREEKVTVEVAGEAADGMEAPSKAIELQHIPVDKAAQLLLKELGSHTDKPEA